MCLLALILKSDIDTLIICIYTAQGKLVIFTKVTIMDNPPPPTTHTTYTWEVSLEVILNQRPMGHIGHLRHSSNH